MYLCELHAFLKGSLNLWKRGVWNMAYTALYRKFRPLKFEDMVGQEHITKTLKNQIMAGRVGHAYLFNGGRGTGKTTTAKILARAVNCLNPQNGEPCNECEICQEILDASLTDVVEMDAASNNSVEDIRAIRDEVNFLPTKAKYRVYIIDEVHMLSVGAFNALLKTLEEPPEHVKFILATTEPQKLPATILSRCQRFDYKKINDENVIKRLNIICTESNIKITENALKTIAILSEGAMRDAISILERCSQESSDEITIDLVKDLVGLPSLEYIHKLTKALFENNEIIALEAIEDVINNGKDLYNFIWEVIKYTKDILIYKATQKLDLYSEQQISEIKDLAGKVEKERLLNVIYQLSELENNIKNSAQKTILLQTGIIKICMNQANGDIIKLEEKVAQLEQKINNLNFSTLPKVATTTQSKQIMPKPTQSTTTSKQVVTPTKQTEDWKEIVENLKNSGKIRLFTCLVNTTVNKLNDQTWEIEFPNGLTEFNKRILEDITNRNDLIKAIAMSTGYEINFKLKDGKKAKPTEAPSASGFDDLGIDINIID